MVKLVIFDWDGTLFDSIDTICDSMLKAGELAHAPVKHKDDIKNIIGLSLDKAVAVVWPELSLREQGCIVEHYKQLYVSADQTPPSAYPGVMSVLNQFKEAGVLMAVATGKSRRGLERAFSLTQTKAYFIASRCADETLSKPDPLMLNELLDELSLSSEEAVMVGDTEYDLNMASNAGIKSIGVTYGAHEEARLKACQPMGLIEDFTQLPRILGL
ncbi:HAD-IA family hydrolase [Marinomonas sp. A79]|uniref:HAD-IA family hydrolase n=1 Tax=Marinomonas vulgaris TaxID=2823372 RepID=A0ABS5H9R0_9GAMM|nr:HAD-IA family hydrolase [Marinomonas vulgaris]MBR7888421.1 HAD-IA family hydrolase [Marinomonas vulgaris]